MIIRTKAIKQYEEYVEVWGRKFNEANEKCRTEQEEYDAMMSGNVDLANEIYKEREDAELYFFLYNRDLDALKRMVERQKSITLRLAGVAASIVVAVLPITVF